MAVTIIIPGVNDHLVDDYSNAEHVAKPHGLIFQNGKEVASTLQCCHGGEHWVVRKGSGIRRGFCMRCMAPTCGKDECIPCKPFVDELGLSQGRIL